MKKFPNLKTLAEASDEDIIEILESLGLRWRISLLISMVKILTSRYKGKIPSKKQELQSLPGVGDYISSAVRSFALGFHDPILDTNTVRILGRLNGIQTNDSSRRNKKFKIMYNSLCDGNSSREFNFGMLDLAALLCTPSKPSCEICPVKYLCKYGTHSRRDEYERDICN